MRKIDVAKIEAALRGETANGKIRGSVSFLWMA